MNPRVLAAAADWTLPELAISSVEHQISGARSSTPPAGSSGWSR